MANYKFRNLDEEALEYIRECEKCNQWPVETAHAVETCYCYAAEATGVLRPGYYGSFGQAIEALRRGFKVAREGWNGKGMFLWLKPAATIKSEWCKDPMLKDIVDAQGGEIEALGTICMKTADNKILTGWLASQTDMLSVDWIIVE